MEKSTAHDNVLLLCESESAAQTDRRALRDAGFPAVRLMTSGIDAARMLAGLDDPPEGGIPSFIVCAQKLADMDGEQFCAIVRQHPLLLGFPILLILPNDSEAEQLKTLGCGASALLGRPYSAINLKTKINGLLKAAPTREMLHAAASQVDTSAFDSALATYGVLLRPARQPDDYFRVGMSCLENHRWNLAISSFEHALRHAQIKAEAELGMAAAFKGKGDMTSCKIWLGRASQTFVAARRWHHARAAYAKLLRHDPEAKNPFISEAHKLIRQRSYEAAADVLAQGASVTPRKDAGDRYARLCFAADDPEAMLKALEEGLSKEGAIDFLGEEIRTSLEGLTREREARLREQAAERKWRLAREMAQAKPAPQEKMADKQTAKTAVFFEEDTPVETESDNEELSGPEAAGPILEPLTQEEATSDLFEEKPRLNELLSVVKLTWKLARRSKKDD